MKAARGEHAALLRADGRGAAREVGCVAVRTAAVMVSLGAALACGCAATDAPTDAPAVPAERAHQSAAEPATLDAWTVLSPSIRIQRAASRVEFAATSVIETGFLEEYVCTVGTREHESLFAFDGKASEIHAAMLLAGFVAGAPGQWREVASDDGAFRVEGVAPRGDGVDVEVRLEDGRVVPIAYFVRASPVGEAPPAGGPPSRFVFGGSRFRADRRTGVERYLADGSGSLIGLVTFGDETIGPSEIVPDQASAAAPLWEAFTERMPKPGTKVTVLLSRRRAAPPAPHPSETGASPRPPVPAPVEPNDGTPRKD